jgi:hypothetical protein
MPFIQGISVSAFGGQFLPVAQRRRQPYAQKTVIYAGSDLGTIAAIAADPEQRFLLLLAYESGTLYSLNLGVSGALPALELTALQLPHLALSRRISVSEHETEGRFYRFYDSKGHFIAPGASFSFLVDADNDGVFDAHETIQAGAAFLQSPWSQYDMLISLVDLTGTGPP